jgi:hypothetical protein
LRSQGRIAGYRIGGDQSGGNGTILQFTWKPSCAGGGSHSRRQLLAKAIIASSRVAA